MVEDTPWELEADSKDRAWKHTGNGTIIHLLDMNNEEECEAIDGYSIEERWVLTGMNSIIKTFDATKEEALETARNWMRDNQNPSPMI